MMATTIYDVAHKAGVSISTVSRVLNNNPNVQEDTRQKVLKSIAELKFKPNPIARGLVVKQTNLIEVFFSWSGYQFNLQSAWYVGLLNGINEVVQENQYGLLINTIAGVFDPQEVYRKVYHNALDGVLMVSPYLEEKDVLEMMDQRIPVVLIGYRTDDLQMDYVDSDNVDAAVQVVDHLVKLGHKKIAFISGQIGTSRNALDRLKGFQQAMKKHGLAIPEGYIVDGNFLRESGAEGMKKLLTLPERPTAVFASNDLMALGAWDVAEEAGLTVGGDIAIVGFDDITEAFTPPYSLTTVRQDYRTISVEATRILLEKIRKPDHGKPRQVLVPTQLIVRQSCGSKKKWF
jgi:DNA-binding LacI/PurR family transcriptional regulator